MAGVKLLPVEPGADHGRQGGFHQAPGAAHEGRLQGMMFNIELDRPGFKKAKHQMNSPARTAVAGPAP